MQAADNPRLHALLNAPIGPLLSRLAAPNIVVLTVQTLVTIADAWFVGRLGVTALASLAIVFPVQTMMLMMSAGAMGGGISSAVARALGAGDQARADAITLHAIVIAVLMAAAYLVIAAIFAEPLFRLLGGQGPVLAGATAQAQRTKGGKARDDVGRGTTAKDEEGKGSKAEKKSQDKKFLGIF